MSDEWHRGRTPFYSSVRTGPHYPARLSDLSQPRCRAARRLCELDLHTLTCAGCLYSWTTSLELSLHQQLRGTCYEGESAVCVSVVHMCTWLALRVPPASKISCPLCNGHSKQQHIFRAKTGHVRSCSPEAAPRLASPARAGHDSRGFGRLRLWRCNHNQLQAHLHMVGHAPKRRRLWIRWGAKLGTSKCLVAELIPPPICIPLPICAPPCLRV